MKTESSLLKRPIVPTSSIAKDGQFLSVLDVLESNVGLLREVREVAEAGSVCDLDSNIIS